jgi:hypothetical protein
MNYDLCSNDPMNYGTLKFDLNFPINCSRARYRITHFSTLANFLITEDTDSFKISFFDEKSVPPQMLNVIVQFDSRSSYGNRPSELLDLLNELINRYEKLKTYEFEFEYTKTGTLNFCNLKLILLLDI